MAGFNFRIGVLFSSAICLATVDGMTAQAQPRGARVVQPAPIHPPRTLPGGPAPMRPVRITPATPPLTFPNNPTALPRPTLRTYPGIFFNPQVTATTTLFTGNSILNPRSPLGIQFILSNLTVAEQVPFIAGLNNLALLNSPTFLGRLAREELRNVVLNPGAYTPPYGMASYSPSSSSSGNPYQMNTMSAAPPYTPTYTAQAPYTSAPDLVLSALGLPTKDGHLDWPLALAALPHSEESGALRRQVEAAMIALAAAEKDKAPASLVGDARRAVDRLKDLFYSNRYSMTPGTRRDAERFLDKLDDVLARFG